MPGAVWADKAEWLQERAREVAADVTAGSSAKLWALVKATAARRPCRRRPAAPAVGLDGRTLQTPAEVVAE